MHQLGQVGKLDRSPKDNSERNDPATAGEYIVDHLRESGAGDHRVSSLLFG